MNITLQELFQNRTIPVVSKHKKAILIGPIMEKHLGCEVVSYDSFDTDQLGTFTGERKRTLSPIDAALEKCKAAVSLGGYDCALASEGTFGNLPPMPFVPSNQEIVVFYDAVKNYSVVGTAQSYETNTCEESVKDWESLKKSAQEIGFPQTWVILKNQIEDKNGIQTTKLWKDIFSWETLEKLWNTISHNYPANTLFLCPDFRAMANPLRQRVIQNATLDLIQHLKSQCPKCGIPGFRITERVRGLPCCFCGFPTDGILQEFSTCSHCKYQEQKKELSHGKNCQDPAFCQFCNP